MQIAAADVAGARLPSTSFVGRRDELGRLRTLLADNRLTTITGTGGAGKTRLAEELASQLARSFAGALAFAYLADVTETAQVGDVVASCVGLRGAEAPALALVEYLQARRYLLVLDNCEHLRAGVADLVVAILRACPLVTILATSRRPLLVPGEQSFPIEGLEDDAAVSLFTDRVRLVSPSFVLSEEERPVAVRLCARLDGMPLAIELGAARLRHLGLADLEQRMTGRMGDLGSVDSVAPARHRTLRAAIDWSHGLLDDRQQTLWRRLSIFAGGFTLASAEEVASFPPLVAGDVATLLGELVDRSMVAFDLAHGRYRLIEAMREYGLERLRAAGEEPSTLARHRTWILGRAEELDRQRWGPNQATALDEMSAEAGNLRAALESCKATGAGEDGLRIATASLWYWMTRASHAEAARWFVPFLEHATDPTLAARAYVAAGWIAVLSARLPESRRFLERAAGYAASSEDAGIHAYIRIVTALLLISEQDPVGATELAVATLADPAADPMCRSWALIEIGIIALLGGDLAECDRISRQAIEMCQAAGESWTRVTHLHLLAAATWRQGDPQAASSLLRDALRIDRRLDDIWHRAWTIEAMGWIAVDLGRPERAARLLGIATGCWDYTGSSMTEPWQPFHDSAVETLQRRMGRDRLAREIETGRRLDPIRALSYALEEAQANERPSDGPRVSPRELEVAALVAEGLGNREIGERLFLSPRTVETHVQHLMDKLAVGSRAEIAAWFARDGREG